MVRSVRPSENFATQHPAHADEFAAFCEFNVIGTTDCRIVVRYASVVSVIWSVHLTSMDEWPSQQDLLDWGNARNDGVLWKLAQKIETDEKRDERSWSSLSFVSSYNFDSTIVTSGRVRTSGSRVVPRPALVGGRMWPFCTTGISVTISG